MAQEGVRIIEAEKLQLEMAEVLETCASALSDPTEITPPPYLRDRCSNTPVALCFLWCPRLLLLDPHFFP